MFYQNLVSDKHKKYISPSNFPKNTKSKENKENVFKKNLNHFWK
jgi:hypothetical protein